MYFSSNHCLTVLRDIKDIAVILGCWALLQTRVVSMRKCVHLVCFQPI